MVDPTGRWWRMLSRIAFVAALGVLGAGAIAAVNLSRVEPVRQPAPVAPVMVAERVATGAPAPAEAAGSSGARGSAVSRVDPRWAATTAAATGIPVRALLAYAAAALVVAAEQPGCGIGWNTLAGIGAIESDHGRHGGSVLGEDGYPVPAIRGPALDGAGVAAIADTDGGAWDGDARWDRAVGPLQFIPDTWRRWGADANGDGVADPNQIDDAALAAGRYLCAGGSVSSPEGWRRAVFSYNHLDSYVDDVAATANRYAAAAGTVTR